MFQIAFCCFNDARMTNEPLRVLKVDTKRRAVCKEDEHAFSYSIITFLMTSKWLLLLAFLNLQKAIQPVSNNENFLFITIKSTESNHKTRLTVLEDTWLQNLKPSEYKIVSDSTNNVSQGLENQVIKTSCGNSHSSQDLICKLKHELLLFHRHNAHWSCHFDDDSYVNILNLKKFLSQYDSKKRYYFGKVSTGPIHIKGFEYWFGTGGAGYCLSRPVTQKMFQHVSKIFKRYFGLPDDIMLAVLASKTANTTLTNIDLFHSHLEPTKLLRSHIKNQISLSQTVLPGSLFQGYSTNKWMYYVHNYLHYKIKNLAIKLF
ncbi:unnamed protein product [Bursaphelenchus okinawaensis]|uniref:Fringe-like glycosyltransferase domain-containing protein n=1 Tax=Bursaphelenchus okinawaensis TaxID=465554 RepID=A0A811KPB8_9BILA|nr:unnamed protein product [Bursaphelenchus okinawaensis]CAG9107879.1 unnamed protein product [Bursaphelenchus okinawaensis]